MRLGELRRNNRNEEDCSAGGSTLYRHGAAQSERTLGDRDECAVCRNHSQLPDFGDDRGAVGTKVGAGVGEESTEIGKRLSDGADGARLWDPYGGRGILPVSLCSA